MTKLVLFVGLNTSPRILLTQHVGSFPPINWSLRLPKELNNLNVIIWNFNFKERCYLFCCEGKTNNLSIPKQKVGIRISRPSSRRGWEIRICHAWLDSPCPHASDKMNFLCLTDQAQNLSPLLFYFETFSHLW